MHARPIFTPLVTGALLTGFRYGKLASMTADDFNPYVGTPRVRASKERQAASRRAEGRGSRFVSAGGREARQLAFVLPQQWQPWRKSEQQRPLSAACAAARIDPPVNFHGLRHTYASRLAMRGGPLEVIAKQLGHVDTRMVEKYYGHLAPSYVADTVRAAFGSLGVVPPSNVAPIAAAIARLGWPPKVG
jgi:integrase